MRNFILSAVLIVNTSALFSQSVGIGTQQPAPSAALQIQSTSQGVLFPRVTSAQRNNIANPATGLMVYDLDKHTLYLFDGQRWMPLLYATDDSLLPATVVTASDGEHGDSFGKSIAIDGAYAIAGAPDDKVGNNFVQGSAYIFKQTNGAWEEHAKLVATNGSQEDFFGISVDIDGDYAVVGAPYKAISGDEGRGAIYVFVRNGDTWTQQAMLTASDGSESDHFGHDVAIDGEFIIASAPYNDVGLQNDRGTVYVFKRNGNSWYQHTAINPAQGLANDNIGESLAIDSNTIAIGAPNDFNNNYNNCGTVYMYVLSGNTWTPQGILLPNTPQNNLQFGRSVALHRNKLIVGAPYFTFNGAINSGAVFAYKRQNSTWNYFDSAIAPEYFENSSFGCSVGVNDDYVIGGAFGHDIDFHNGAGRVWVFTWTPTTLEYVQHIDDDTPGNNNYFGWGVSLSDHQLMMSSPQKNHMQGAVFFKSVD